MADRDIVVRVVEFSDRACFQLQYFDPLSRRKKTKTSGVERDGSKKARREAERAAGVWQDELRSGRYSPPSKSTWADFRERYEREVLASLAQSTDEKVAGVFNAIEKIVNPERLRDLTAERLSYFQSKLRDKKLAETTIAGMLAHVRAALNWAVKMGMLPKAPTIERPRRAKGSKMMKGRPITTEEFERMLGKVEAVVGIEAAASWKHYLRGLWASGLRLAESLELHWDRPDKLRVDLDGKRPMLHIPAELEKGNKDRLLPMAPEFAEFISNVPVEERTGLVFKPLTRLGRQPSEWWASRTIGVIGEAAGVKVDQRTKDGKPVVKYASAHDLRRSFGARWATRVMPQVLMELMRHESIETTLKFYVGRNAETTADVLWQAHNQAASGNTSGNSDQNSGTSPGTTSDQSDCSAAI